MQFSLWNMKFSQKTQGKSPEVTCNHRSAAVLAHQCFSTGHSSRCADLRYRGTRFQCYSALEEGRVDTGHRGAGFQHYNTLITGFAGHLVESRSTQHSALGGLAERLAPHGLKKKILCNSGAFNLKY